jgi:putative addiction module killer protein
MRGVFEVRYYLTKSGKNVFESWLESLDDDVAEARIDARINRLTGGNFGDCKPVGGGVWELRIDWGAGVSHLLRDDRPTMRPVAGWRRQT